jgi:hypothetical protein
MCELPRVPGSHAVGPMNVCYTLLFMYYCVLLLECGSLTGLMPLVIDDSSLAEQVKYSSPTEYILVNAVSHPAQLPCLFFLDLLPFHFFPFSS